MNQKFEIISKKIDYLKMVVYREKKYFLKWDAETDKNPPSVCETTEKIIRDFKLTNNYKSIMNEKGLGINNYFKQKLMLDFRGEFFLRNKYEYINDLIKFLNEKGLKYKITRLDIAVDYKYFELLPFKDKKSHFGKIKKSTILIPEKFRGDLNRATEWVQTNPSFIATFYDKTKEINSNKNKEKKELYSEIYKTDQIYRFELKLLKNKAPQIAETETELAVINNSLKDWYDKNNFSVHSKNIKLIFEKI